MFTTQATPRHQLLETAVGLFREFGFGAVAMRDVVARSSISRETLYREFPSKEKLIVAVLERYDLTGRKFFARAVENAGPTLRSKLLAFFDTLEDLFADPTFCGCLFINATVEYPDVSDPVHRIARAHKDRFRGMMVDLATDHGLPNAQDLGHELMLVFDGLCVTYQRTRNRHEFQSAKRLAKILLDHYGVE